MARMQLNLFNPIPLKERATPMSDVQYGPTRFEEQPAWVRARGRKGLAKATATQRAKRRRAWARAKTGHGGRTFKELQTETYGPMRFEDQPAWVRRRGKKSKRRSRASSSSTPRRSRKASRKSARRSSARSSARSYSRKSARRSSKRKSGGGLLSWIFGRPSRTGKGKSKRARKCNTQGSRELKAMVRAGMVSRKQAKKARRQMYRAKGATRRLGKRACRSMGRSYGRAVKGGYSMTRRSRKSSRGVSRRSSRSMARSGPSRVLTYNTLMKELHRRPKLKAWVCVGRTRTGCGGGRKGYRGSRQLGLLRP
jgi:hypothetical protein